MKTIYITRKMNDSTYGSYKIEKKLRKIKQRWLYSKIECPIKLVFEEGIKKINLDIINNEFLEFFVEEIVYANSLIELPKGVFVNLRKVRIPSNLKELCYSNFCHSKLKEINLHNKLECINDSTFFGMNLNEICIYPSVKKIGHLAFDGATIKKLIFLSKDTDINSSAFYKTKIDKLYCLNKDLLILLYSDFSKKMGDLINIKDTKNIDYNLENLFLPVEELTISQHLIFDFLNILEPLKNYFSKKLIKKIIIDCSNDFYHNLLYKQEIETLKEKLCCEVILSHDYVVENFEEAKDIYIEPKIDTYSKKINGKCNQILDSCYNIELKEKILNYLINIVKKHNNTLLEREKYRYNDFSNICLSVDNDYYNSNTFMKKLDDILNKVNLLNNSILLNNNILLFLNDIEILITDINISNINLNYLNESLYSDIYKYLYILELTDSDIKEKYKFNLLNIISNYKNIINKNISNNINNFPNINISYKNICEFELEFRKYFFKELLSFYEDYFKCMGIDGPKRVDKAINGIYDNSKNNQRNIYYKVITDLIREIKELNYTKDKYIIKRLDNIININLIELEDDKLDNIIKELSRIKYFLQYKENMLKEKGLFKLVKRK